MSSFKKNENLKNKEESHKATFGHPELDAVFQNSLLKSQVMVIREDSPTTLYLQLLRYFVGSQYQSNGVSIIYDRNPQQWLQMIPILQQQTQQKQQKQSQGDTNIAWRYNKMQIQYKLTNINPNIPKLDLSKHVEADSRLLKLIDITTFKDYKSLLQSITQSYQNSLKSSTDYGLKKLVIRLRKWEWEGFDQFLYELKVLIRSSHLFVVITVPTGFEEEQLMHFSDYFLSLKQIYQNEQFEDFQGVLEIEKVFGGVKLELSRWGVKSSNRELEIEMLYETAVKEDEEDKQKLLACGAGKPSDKEKLDF